MIRNYFPITAAPFRHNKSYAEISPCDALKPYIRCFWGTSGTDILNTEDQAPVFVIPDTCMDIIFYLDHKNNFIRSDFCGVDENSYSAVQKGFGSIFGIRFYAWTAVLFAENSFAGSRNKVFDTEHYFSALKKELIPALTSLDKLEERAKLAEKYLFRHLNTYRINSDLMNGIFEMVNSGRKIKISDIADKNAISKKQLERIFNENMGISPKSFSTLVRYQLLWQEMVFSKSFNILDLVDKYGYADQSHLLKDFKKRHLMTPTQALEYARSNR